MRRGSQVLSIVVLALSACLAPPDFFGAQGGGTSGGADGGTGGFAGAGGTGGSGVGGGQGGMAGGMPVGGGAAGGPDGGFSQPRASRSSTVAVLGGVQFAINADLDVLVLTATPTGVSNVALPAGSQPSALAVLPSGKQAVVTLRKTQELAMVSGLTTQATIDWRIRVCSEPAGVALSPSGRTAVIACMGEPAVILVDTLTRDVRRLTVPGVARAVAITNDGDADDTDEHAYVPLFYGEIVDEGTDQGRRGRVIEIDLGTGLASVVMTLAPIADTGFGPTLTGGAEGQHVACSPNQLYAIAIADGRAFITHTCVSPEPPLQKLTTVSAGLSVLDLQTHTEIAFQSTTLGRIARTSPNTQESLLGVPIDLDVDPGGNVLAVLSQAASRVAFLNVARGTPLTPTLGPAQLSVPVTGRGACMYPMTCFFDGGMSPLSEELDGVPTGVVMTSINLVTVNDLTGRKLFQLNPSAAVSSALRYAPAPFHGSAEHELALGKKFFFTGLGRWSHRDVGSCGSCHPDGLSDNITWVFGAGPRQTPALDGTFAKGNASDHRAQNWTAIFDEVYDVEGVTRNVLGGVGALVFAMEVPIPLSAGFIYDGGTQARGDNLSGSSRAINDAFSVVKDWSQIEQYVQTIEANRGPIWSDPNAVQRGRTVFAQAKCAACHGGPKWTVSRVPYVPSPSKNGSLPGDNGVPAVATGLRTELRDGGSWLPFNRDTFKVAVEKLPSPDGGAELSIGPERITCVLRDVGTFDPADPFERKTDGTTAQGALGFNPPSLLGLASSAPYLHHGAAATLPELFQSRWATHFRAGEPTFTPTPSQISDLVAFLFSIDDFTQTFPAADTVDLCEGY